MNKVGHHIWPPQFCIKYQSFTPFHGLKWSLTSLKWNGKSNFDWCYVMTEIFSIFSPLYSPYVSRKRWRWSSWSFNFFHPSRTPRRVTDRIWKSNAKTILDENNFETIYQLFLGFRIIFINMKFCCKLKTFFEIIVFLKINNWILCLKKRRSGSNSES